MERHSDTQRTEMHATEALTRSGAILRQHAFAQEGRPHFDDHITRAIRSRRFLNGLMTASITFLALSLSTACLIWTLSLL